MRRQRRPKTVAPLTDAVVHATVDFGPCPDCGLPIQVSHTEDLQPLAVVHPLPMCKTFDETTADAYLKLLLDVRLAARMPTVME